MQSLIEFDLLELLKRQAMVDEAMDNKKLKPRDRTVERNIIAMLTEAGELCQCVKKDWNFWKNNCKYDKLHTLEEISDYLHFLLAHINLTCTEDTFKDINEYQVLFREKINNDKMLSSVDIESALLVLYSPLSLYVEREELDLDIIFMILSAIYYLIRSNDSNVVEFLEIHHKKFLKNLGERTQDTY